MNCSENSSTRKISVFRSFRKLKSSEELGQALRELNSSVREETSEQPCIPKSRPKLISFKSQSTLSTLQESDSSLVGFRDLSNGLKLDQLKELVFIDIPKQTGRSFRSPGILMHCESLEDENLAIVADWMMAISSRCNLAIPTKHLVQRFVGIIRKNHGEYEASGKAFLSAAWISQRSLSVPTE